MSLRTILLHSHPGDPHNEARADLALSLCAAHGAHLTAVHAIPPIAVPTYGAVPLPPEIFDQYYAEAEAESAAAESKLLRKAAAQGQTAAWHAVRGYPREVLLAHARYCDLVVVGQPDPERGDIGGTEGLLGDLAIGAGRPVIAVPHAGRHTGIGKRILVCWNDSREATRAAHDALPLLTTAELVTVLVVNAEEDLASAEEISAHLARHGVTVEAKTEKVRGLEIGDAILNAVSDLSCDMLVMGAYGHSRLREFAFGGVTRHIIDHMTVPTLFSH
jgi:nucleotide-binding universal stress UspA family protein